MKALYFAKKLVIISLMGLILSCEDNGSGVEADANKVVVLKVDFSTNEFEGGTELAFPASSSFTISSTYDPPGDFGSIQLFYSELNEMIFDGSIHWAGLGKVSYPAAIDSPYGFSQAVANLPIPEEEIFQSVVYDEFAYYPEIIEYSQIWNAISRLAIVSNYRNSNPNGKINLFLYTPSVGVGDPAEWDWYVYIQN